MIQLIYTSVATRPFTSQELRELLRRARETNERLGVSGMLLHVDGSFLQVLEGERDVLMPLYDRIAKGTRHKRVLTLLARDVSERNFPDWSMGFFDGTGRASLLAGYRVGTTFADLLGDSAAVLKIASDFRDGRWSVLAA